MWLLENAKNDKYTVSSGHPISLPPTAGYTGLALLVMQKKRVCQICHTS